MLEDAELSIDGKLTFAALIMLGTHKALGRYLAQAETVFEYRSSEASVSYQQREEFRRGFLLYLDELWQLISLRNEVHEYQEGLFRRSIPTFNEKIIREALLNALAHRDYRMAGSIFVRQFPKRLEILSPGGFPPGITEENILWKQAPRNRRIAEVMAKCDLVERSGQGADLMFSTCVRESKPLPNYSASDSYEVHLVLDGEVQDDRFLQYLDRVGSETLASFSSDDFLLLDVIHRELAIHERLRPRLPRLLDLGVIESKGRGRGTRYLLSERFYKLSGGPGTYTRKKGVGACSWQESWRTLVSDRRRIMNTESHMLFGIYSVFIRYLIRLSIGKHKDFGNPETRYKNAESCGHMSNEILPAELLGDVRTLIECARTQAADAGAKRLLLPMASVGDIATIPGELFAKFQTSFYSDPRDAAFKALGVE